MSLVVKLFSDVPDEKVISVLEDARADCQYQSLPIKDIKRRATASGLTGYTNGRYIDAWAVDLNGKYKMCSCLAQNDEGAKVQMGKYLTKHNIDPTGYTLFTDHESFWNYRMQCIGVR
jgi:hypothetical protein